MNTAADIQTRVGGASDLPYVGGFVDKGVQGLQEKLKSIGGLINPTLGAAFGGPTIKNIGDLYAGNNPKSDKANHTPVNDPYPDGKNNLGNLY